MDILYLATHLILIDRRKGDFGCNVFSDLLLLLTVYFLSNLEILNFNLFLLLEMSKCVHLFTNSEVKHVRKGFHGEFLSAACVQKSRFIFSNKVSIRVRWLVGLWQLPEEGELLWWIKISQLLILSNHLGGLSSSVTGEMGTFCWAATDCLRGNHLKVLTLGLRGNHDDNNYLSVCDDCRLISFITCCGSGSCRGF